MHTIVYELLCAYSLLVCLVRVFFIHFSVYEHQVNERVNDRHKLIFDVFISIGGGGNQKQKISMRREKKPVEVH